MNPDTQETGDFHTVFALDDQGAETGDAIGAFAWPLVAHKGAQQQRHGFQEVEPLRPFAEQGMLLGN